MLGTRESKTNQTRFENRLLEPRPRGGPVETTRERRYVFNRFIYNRQGATASTVEDARVTKLEPRYPVVCVRVRAFGARTLQPCTQIYLYTIYAPCTVCVQI